MTISLLDSWLYDIIMSCKHCLRMTVGVEMELERYRFVDKVSVRGEYG